MDQRANKFSENHSELDCLSIRGKAALYYGTSWRDEEILAFDKSDDCKPVKFLVEKLLFKLLSLAENDDL